MIKRLRLATLVFLAASLVSCEKGVPSDTVNQIRKERILLIGTVPFEAPLLHGREKGLVGPEAKLGEKIFEKVRDIIVEAGGSSKIELIWATRTYKTLVPSLLEGGVPMILGVFGITEERRGQVAFSDPYYKSELVLVINPPHKDLRLEKLDGVKIGVREGTAIEQFALREYKGSTIVSAPTLDEGILSLKRRELDAFIDDRYMAAYALDTIPGVAHLEILPTVLGTVECAIAVRQTDKVSAGTYAAFLDIINGVVGESNTEGLYAKWLQEETGDLLARVEKRHPDRLESLKPRRVVIRVSKDKNYNFDIYRVANLKFKLVSQKTGKSYSSSRIRFRGSVGVSTTNIPPGIYQVTLPKMNDWSPGSINIVPADSKKVTVRIQLKRGGTSSMTRS